MRVCDKSELAALVDLSARLGRNPLLTQAASGNTSIKLGSSLWVKASGKWLADAANEPIFACLDLSDGQFHRPRSSVGDSLEPSIETAMHAVLSHRVVVHVHSVNTIAWAVRRDGADQLARRLNGLRWRWIPHVPSGAPLAQEIARTLRRFPDTNIFVLANHGLVVCGDSCDAAEACLNEVERRVAIVPREQLVGGSGGRAMCVDAHWRLPDLQRLHALGTEPVSQDILSAGVLYPCQAIFLEPSLTILKDRSHISVSNARYSREHGKSAPFFILRGQGVVIHESITRAEYEMLVGLMEVVQRLDRSAPIRYLTPSEVAALHSAEAHHYRMMVEPEPSRCSY